MAERQNKRCPRRRGPITAVMTPPQAPDYWVRIEPDGEWNVSKRYADA